MLGTRVEVRYMFSAFLKRVYDHYVVSSITYGVKIRCMYSSAVLKWVCEYYV